ncbi:GMP synthase (glutamine-hydrolyzing) [candidate division KSB1 bacterium]|nr:MAG: GMP synthase (glutamine-hydrolyzing) [candidate division KSB1 bacterium]
MHQKLIILDFGGQYTQLIARRVREQNVFCEIYPYNISLSRLNALKPDAIILSGGPMSIYEKGAPRIDKEILEIGVPVLGICYGLCIIADIYGGKVIGATKREFGRAELNINDNTDIFKGVSDKTIVWMSHGDRVVKIPDSFEIIAYTENSPIAAVRNREKKLFGVQFHPEVIHTIEGKKILSNFLFEVCGFKGDWTPASFVDETVKKIKEQVKNSKIICALSGGVDSSVTSILVHRAVGKNLTCIFVDNGLLRAGEKEQVENTFRRNFHVNLVSVDASDRFLKKLKGITDPEEKRRIIGREFISVFEEEAEKLGRVEYLAQGTLYPDLIESVSFKGPSATIKTHHNVGGLPEKMNLKLIEPLKELFKDEVRRVGKELGIPEEILCRHPFPGPGLGVRIIGEVTKEKLEILRKADEIFIDEIKRYGIYNDIWQALTVLLPVRTVGVMGDDRTYESVIALRAVTSMDGMTADWFHLPYELMEILSSRIINEVRGVNRVVYDISSKPPSTIEWE